MFFAYTVTKYKLILMTSYIITTKLRAVTLALPAKMKVLFIKQWNPLQYHKLNGLKEWCKE